MKTIAFLNNKGGVGKTTLVYHLAWMFQELGVKVVAVDLDAQSNLSAAFLDDDRLAELWSSEKHPETILGVIDPLLEREGDIQPPHVEPISDAIGLVTGDLRLNLFEERLATSWISCLDDNSSNARDGLKVTTAFYRAIAQAAAIQEAEIALIDVAPNLGLINRAALIASDYVVVPLGADLFSIQGLRNLGPTLQKWREGWRNRKSRPSAATIAPLPEGLMKPIGYVVMQPAVRKNYPVRAYQKWIERIPSIYSQTMLHNEEADHLSEIDANPSPENDTHRLGILKHYRSLIPMSLEARKPIFQLKPADGAIGGHARAVRDCLDDFESLARNIAAACGVEVPQRYRVTMA